MMQKNKLNSNYFLYSIIAVLSTGALFILFGYNGWGPPAGNEQAIGEISRWCERVSSGFFREPVNTLGNLGFVFTGLFMFYKITQDATSNKSPMFGSFKIALLYASASTFLGPGSMAMHGTHTAFGAWLDNVSMISYILIFWLYNLKVLKNLSNKTFFISYSILLSYYAYSYWFLDSGLGIGVDLFELSIGLWISTEILIKLPNLYGRIISVVTILIVMQLFGIDVLDLLSNIQDNWKSFLNLIPVFIPNINSNVERTYRPWAFIGYISFYSAFVIREIGMPNHPWCDPDSLIQAHMIWHLLCAVSTISFFNFQRKEIRDIKS
tara:strand:- start:2603 stop:3571 length:969 start_codon:yes stop_codon:yes gene_type:complete